MNELTTKQKYGEVFTPQKQICEMIHKLPKEVWKNPDLKWLDPAAGTGNFASIIIPKLHKELKTIIHDDKERMKHILQHMIYMVEINPENVRQIEKSFQTSNIYCADFLTWTPPESIVFDIIIGNPPYNDIRRFKKKNSQTLWDPFVSTILTKYIIPGGYFCFIHPPGWRKPGSELFHSMTKENHMLYVEMHHFSDGLVLFDAETRYDWYVIKGGAHDNCLSTIKDMHGNLHLMTLSDKLFLPNYFLSTIYSLECKNRDKCVPILYNRTQYGSDKYWTQSEKDSEYKYPLVHSTPKKGIRYYYTNTLNPPVRKKIKMFGVSKVIFGEGGAHNPLIDMDGKYGMTGCAMAILVSSLHEAKLLCQILKSDAFKQFVNAMSVGYFRIDWKLFLHFKADFYKNLPLLM